METTETLEHGDYCDVTREQALELYTIEGQLPESIANRLISTFANRKEGLISWWCEESGIIMSSYHHGDITRFQTFPDFKQRLINTVNNK